MSRAENEELDLEETQKVPGFIQSPSGNFAPLFGTFYNLLWGEKDIVLQAITGRTSLFLCEVKNGRKNEILNRNEYNQRCKRGGNRRPSPRKVGKQTFCPGGPAFGDVETERVLQDISGEQLSRWSYKAQDARLDIHVLGFWERHRSAFFDVRVFHPNAESYKDL